MSTSNGVKRTGEMMLSGWKLLADHCPICNFPLMSKKEELRCPGCDMAVLTEEDIAGKRFYEEKPTAAIGSAAALEVPSSHNSLAASDNFGRYDEPDLPSSLEEMKKEYDRKNARMNKVSAKLGEKMMAGWTLLGTICPDINCNGTPLMKPKGETSMLCVCCEKWYVDQGNGLALREEASVKPSVPGAETKESRLDRKPASSVEVPSSTPADLYRLDLNDAPFLLPLGNDERNDVMDASEKIARKLLLGWTMLDKVCQGACRGDVPLMRDSEGNVVCVNCCDESKSSKRHPATAPTAKTLQRPITTKEDSEAESSEDDIADDFEDQLDDDVLESYRARRLQELAASAGNQSGSAGLLQKSEPVVAKLTSSARNASATALGVQQKAIDVILEKIKRLMILLESSDSPSEIVELSRTFIALTDAFHAAQSMVKK